MQVIYPQIMEHPLSGIGQGIGMLGNILNQVISQQQDRSLLDKKLVEAQQAMAAGDPSGLTDILSRVQTPQARETVLQAIGLAPKQVYERDKDSGKLVSLGSIPKGAEILSNDPDKQQAMLERQLAVINAQGKLGEQRDISRENRTRMTEDAKDRRQAQMFDFQNRMAEQRRSHEFQLQELRNRGAKKDDLKNQGRLLLKDYQLDRHRLRTDALNEIKALKGTELTDPEGYAAKIKDINDRYGQMEANLTETYGPLAQEYGYKLPGQGKQQGGAAESAPNAPGRAGWNGPAYYRAPDGSKKAYRTKEEYDKDFPNGR